MAGKGLDWLLRLQAKFDTIVGAASAVERLDTSTQQAQRTADSFTAAENRVSAATQDLVDRLAPMQNALNEAFTENQADAAMNRLEKSMSRLGLVWTSEAAEFSSADLLATNSLEQLAQQGFLTADSLAENAHQAKVAAAAMNSEAAAAQQAEREEKALAAAQREAEAAATRHEGAISRLATAFSRAQNPLDGITKKLTRMALSFFTVRKLVRYLINAVARAPDEIGSSLTALKTQISDNFARVTVSALAGMQKGLDRLKAAMDSPGGQRLMRGLENAARLAGQAIGVLLEKVAAVVEWIGNNFQTVVTVAAIALAIYGAKALFAAAATAAVNWPILLTIGLLSALVVALNNAGVTAEQIFTGIGNVAGWLYSVVYNLIADIYNTFAIFAEFLTNLFVNPVDAIKGLFYNMADYVLSLLQSVIDTTYAAVKAVASAIDAIGGTNISGSLPSSVTGTIQGWRNDIAAAASSHLSDSYKRISRMEKISAEDTMASWGAKAGNIASSFSLPSLDAQTPQAIKAADDLGSINKNVGAIRKSVDMAEEDLKSLVDYATRRFVAQFNLQHLAPQITVNGQNTGNTIADAEAIAETIKQMLIEQTANGAYYAIALP